jgi:putative PEP-CTERM system TPR-repeat lipoprotein
MYRTKLSNLIIVTALAISLLACGKKTTEESIFSASQFMQNGDPKSAIVELKNAINSAPENGVLRLQLGNAYFQIGELTAAEKELLKAQDRGVSNVDVVPLLQQVYYYSDQFDSAVNLLEKSSLVKPNALSTAVLFQYMSSIRMKTEQKPLKLDELKPSLSDKDWLVAKTFKLFHDNNYEQAKKQLQQLIAKQHRPVETEYLKALDSYFSNEYVASIESFKRVKELMPTLNSINFQLIEAMIKAEQLDEADQESDKLLRLNDNNPIVNFYKANTAYKRKDFEQASLYSEKAIQNGLDSAASRMIAGVSAYRLDSLEQAYRHLHTLSQRQGFHDDGVNRLLARIQLSLGYNVEASNSLQSLQQLNKSDAELFSLIGANLAMEGDFGNANSLLNQAQKLDDSNNAVKMRLAAMNIGTDEKQAIALLNEVVESDKDLAIGWMQLALAHIRNGDRAAALDVANQWYEIDKANGKTLEGVIYYNTNDLDAALVSFTEAISISPQLLGANQYLLQIYEQRKQPDEVSTVAKNILSFTPNNTQALIALVNSGIELQQITEVEAYLEEMRQADKSIVGPLSALALSKRLNGQPKVAIQLLDKVDTLEPLGFMILGDAYIQSGDIKEGIATYEKWGVKYPNSLFPYLRQIGGHELIGNDQQALHLTESAIKKFPTENMLALLQLHYATKLNRIEDANLILQNIKENPENKNNVLLPYYEGQLALNALEYKKAEKLLLNAHNLSPSYISATMLGKAMIGNGHIKHAKAMFEKQLGNDEKSAPKKFREDVASFYSYIGEYEKAASMYNGMLIQFGESVGLLNNFAFNTLKANGNLEDASIAATKAVALAPENGDVLDTLGWIQFKTNQLGKAYVNLSKAADMRPNSNAINLHFAELLISMGNLKKANGILDKVKRPNNAESKILKQLRNKL